MATPMQVTETGLRVARGLVPGESIVHKFGRAVVGTSLVPVAFGNVYRTPQVSGATALRVKAGDVADTAAGAGAQEVTVQGLDETGALVTETLATAGTSASAATTATFIRAFRAWVSKSGTYATQLAGSHEANVVIEKAAGSEDWLTIDATGFPRGQSEIAVYSVPLGKVAYVQSAFANIDSGKTGTVLFFHRADILQSAAPYSAMRSTITLGGLSGPADFMPRVPTGPYHALTDIGFMGSVSATTGEIDIDFEITLFDA